MSGRTYPLHALLLATGLALVLAAPLGCGGAQPEVPSAWIQGEWELDMGPLVAAVQRDLRAVQAAQQAEEDEANGGDDDAAASEDEGAEEAETEESAEATEEADEESPAPSGDAQAGAFSEQERQFAQAMQQGFRMQLAFRDEGRFRMNGRFMEERSEQSGTWEIVEEAADGLLIKLVIDGEESTIAVYFRGRDVLIVEDEGRQLTFNRRPEEAP